MNTERLQNDYIKANPLANFRKMNSKVIIGFCGVPGSGKTTIAKKIVEKYRLPRIATDDLKIFFVDNGLSYEIKDLFLLQEKLVEFYLKNGLSVIVDSNSDKEIFRSKFYDLGEKYKAKVEFVYCKTSPKTAWKRIKLRKGKTNRVGNDFTIAKEKLLNFFKDLEIPVNCIEVNTNKSLETCVGGVFNKLDQIL